MIGFATPALLSLIPAFLALVAWIVRRERARYVLRAVTILLVLLAFAGPEIALRRPRSYVYILVDRSASIGRSVSDGELFEAEVVLFEDAEPELSRAGDRARAGFFLAGKEKFDCLPAMFQDGNSLMNDWVRSLGQGSVQQAVQLSENLGVAVKLWAGVYGMVVA